MTFDLSLIKENSITNNIKGAGILYKITKFPGILFSQSLFSLYRFMYSAHLMGQMLVNKKKINKKLPDLTDPYQLNIKISKKI